MKSISSELYHVEMSIVLPGKGFMLTDKSCPYSLSSNSAIENIRKKVLKNILFHFFLHQ